MPRICVDDCGLKVDQGSLALDWNAVGSDQGTSRVGGWVVNPVGVPDDWLWLTTTMLAYTNDTCQPRRVWCWTEGPHVYTRMAPGNDWNFGITMALSTAGDPAAVRPSDDHAYLRTNHHGLMPAGSINDFAWTFKGPTYSQLVNPGQTLWMRNMWWWFPDEFAPHAINLIKIPWNVLRYVALPVTS
ncbi:hypothetical protein [Amycolatopsis thermophila]|uniref:Uncharacterized protein n=1 Tax=Amycolatopsis thermophila TaxID=206084 RepID=A0ABU0EMG6_9PSEU|nr:hypothetical protein [Amycolatopsis thermophila]MDQ0376486.1 hypothetical protein [Amycolatopsis thermophila]